MDRMANYNYYKNLVDEIEDMLFMEDYSQEEFEAKVSEIAERERKALCVKEVRDIFHMGTGSLFEEYYRTHPLPFQKKILDANLKPGEKYTLVYFSDFGQPVSAKIKLHNVELSTYAQYNDVVKMIFTPYKKRTAYSKYFYNCELMIYAGWVDIEKNVFTNTVKKENCSVMTFKHDNWSHEYMEDLEKAYNKDLVLTYSK